MLTNNITNPMYPVKPSIYFVKTGCLDSINNEKYNQNLHNYGNAIRERAGDFYTEKEIKRFEDEIKINENMISLLKS